MKITDILEFRSIICFQVKAVEQFRLDFPLSDILSPRIFSRIHGLNLKQYKTLCDSHGANDSMNEAGGFCVTGP